MNIPTKDVKKWGYKLVGEEFRDEVLPTIVRLNAELSDKPDSVYTFLRVWDGRENEAYIGFNKFLESKGLSGIDVEDTEKKRFSYAYNEMWGIFDEVNEAAYFETKIYQSFGIRLALSINGVELNREMESVLAFYNSVFSWCVICDSISENKELSSKVIKEMVFSSPHDFIYEALPRLLKEV